jgi:hypothetical protein
MTSERLKNCADDNDCTAIHSICEEHAGMGGQKTCTPGKR